MKTITQLCILVCFVLTGCTTITPETVNIVRAPIPESMGRMIVYRKPQFAGSGVFPNLFVDKNDRGALTNASVIAIDTNPGEHVLAVKGGLLTYGFSDVTMIAKAEQGKSIYIEYALILAGTTGASNSWESGFRAVDPAIGQIEVDDLIHRVSPQK